MGNYLAQRIIDGKFDYVQVVLKYPDLQEVVDDYLISKDREDLITEIEIE
jgi:hypothetical protein